MDMKNLKDEIKLKDELIKNKNMLRKKNLKNRLSLIGLQEHVEEVFKPIIDPLKKIENQGAENQDTNHLQIVPVQKPMSQLNTDPIPDVTERLAKGIKPIIFKNRNPPEFHIGKRKVPIEIMPDGTLSFYLDDGNDIPITQDLINLINGDDDQFEKYDDSLYIHYFELLKYAKEGNRSWPKRMINLEKRIKTPSIEEIDDQSIEDDLLAEIEQELSVTEGDGLFSNDKLLRDLELLITAKYEGHNNLDDNIETILKELKRRKIISPKFKI